MRDELNDTPAASETATANGTAPSPAIVPPASAPAATAPATGQPGIVEEVLVEEVSIDGMCGVY